MIVIAFDPGKVTGYACWNDQAKDHGLAAAGQLDELAFLRWMEQVVPLYAPWGLTVVGEDFRIGQETIKKGKDAHWALDVLGAVRWICAREHVEFTRAQSASAAKQFASDDKLRALRWYTATPGGHRNDACRHLLLWLVNNGRMDIRLLA